jgi:hypothetical protein
VICGTVLHGRRLGGAWLAAGCASIAFALAVVSTPPRSGVSRPTTAELTAIGGALQCGSLEVYGHTNGSQTGARRATRLIPKLAALTHHSLHDFVIGPSLGHLSGLLWLGGHFPRRPGWVVKQFPSGTLAISSACAATAER